MQILRLYILFKGCGGGGGRTYTKDDMESALDALRDRSLSLTRASEKFGIPPTTLWQVKCLQKQIFLKVVLFFYQCF